MADDAGSSRNDLMVDELVRRGVIRRAEVEAAFRAVPRHWFLPGVDEHEVYRGRVVATHWDAEGLTSSASEPAIMARMLEQLAPRPGDAVLEIGAGTGYNAALLATLVGATGGVVTVDIDPEVTAEAARNLAAAGFDAVDVRAVDGWEPAGPHGAFDRILVTASVWDLAPAWLDELAPDGVLVSPLWLHRGQQASVELHRHGVGLRSRSIEPCGFIPLRGAGAVPPGAVAADGWVGPRWDRLVVDVVPAAAVPSLDETATVGALAVLQRPHCTYVIWDRGTRWGT
ncbi:MAG TPA: methyltransferase domain-containing protein [Acidimicrobiales bacterium]|jgi:protein-L-isoaspartate(D-aspartate) O-methyltransferase|nr:methyltransferase domain-containing protein [Acidimicrobiales bacterium]